MFLFLYLVQLVLLSCPSTLSSGSCTVDRR